ncbi:MAG TPA: cytochrome c [Solirubrobacterales bacterium]|nr:cytochrome c [Solirubrobacterales bacterium]
MPDAFRSHKTRAALLGIGLLALLASGCGTSEGDDVERGRTLFVEKCGNCHTMAQAGTSATLGPNLDHGFAAARAAGMDEDTIRGVVKPQVLHPRPSTDNPTISMPAKIVTGRDLEDVAAYVATYAGVPGAAPPQVEGGPGAQVFADYGCGGCHALADAGSTGSTGPDLGQILPGQNPNQVRESIVDPAAESAQGFPAGVMPSNYGESMSDEELAELVDYLVQATGGN